jgi:hypothetical protein
MIYIIPMNCFVTVLYIEAYFICEWSWLTAVDGDISGPVWYEYANKGIQNGSH